MDHHALLAPIPSDEDYTNNKAYKTAVGRWNDFVAVAHKIDHSRNRFAYCMAAGVLPAAVVPYLDRDNEGDDAPSTGYPLIYPDLHVGNIFVDDAMNVTCIIDWSSATTAPVVELLATPRLWDHNPVTPLLAEPFRQAVHDALPPQLQQQPKEQRNAFWARTDTALVFQRLTHLCSSHDYEDFVTCIASACAGKDDATDKSTAITAVTADVVLDRLGKQAERDGSNALWAEMQDDNPTPSEVAALEGVSFREADRLAATDRLAVARKLTVMWDINPRFVADARLWKWLTRALDDEEGVS